MSDLAAFLAARLDEDEARAKAAAFDPVGAMEAHLEGQALREELDWLLYPGGETDYSQGQADALHWASKAVRERMRPLSLHDPARVLRDVEAGRKLLAAIEAIPHSYIEDCYYSCELAIDPGDPEQRPGSGYCNDNALRTGGCTCGRDELVVRLTAPLAAVYRNHPDYDPAWAV